MKGGEVGGSEETGEGAVGGAVASDEELPDEARHAHPNLRTHRRLQSSTPRPRRLSCSFAFRMSF